MSLPEAAPFAFVGAPAPLPPVEVIPDEGELEILGPTASIDAPPGSRAVVYLRVSSKGQVNTDYDPEGISIPAQRQSCQRKAEQLGLSIVEEYVEAGQSATEMTKRVAFQQMLERIRRDRDVDYVIVYKLSRFARNRIDDAVVMADLQKRGVTLVSATEQIDATPVGQLMHGILAAFNEYRSREDGADISYKMGQKAKNGGTLGRAPIGYLNVTDNIDGRRINTIAIDPERAPFVKLAFDLYAVGQHTFQDIADELTDRGLTTRQTARRPAGPISDSKIQQMLRDRYYLGEITYKGETFDGRHEPLITPELFDRVQTLMDSRGYASERRRKHDHYLKGTLWCGRCRLEDQTIRRMIVMRTTGRQGNAYWYFFCRGAQDHSCDAPYSSVDRVEQALEDHYKTLTFRPEFVAVLRTRLEAALADQAGAQRALRQDIGGQLARLATKEENLLDLAADGDMDTGRVRARLRDLTRQRRELEERVATIADDLTPSARYLEAHIELLENPQELYHYASDETRRLLNQAIFKRIYVVNDEVVGDELNSPMRELLAAERGWSAHLEGNDLNDAIQVTRLEAGRHESLDNQKQAIETDGPLADYIHALLADPAERVGDCSTPHMVPLEGLEPPTLSLGRNCSSIELQRPDRNEFSETGLPSSPLGGSTTAGDEPPMPRRAPSRSDDEREPDARPDSEQNGHHRRGVHEHRGSALDLAAR